MSHREQKKTLAVMQNSTENEILSDQVKHYSVSDSLHIAVIVLKGVFWCMLMALFIMLEFGAVFFILSLFYLMFTNFRETEKDPEELSPYSVFNPDCKAIKGTLTAEQLQKELFLGPVAH